MPNTAVRIYSTGVLSSNGEFDEVTFNPNAGTRAIRNLLNYTDNMSSGSWFGYCGTTANITFNTNDITAPDGTYTSTRVVRNGITACGASTSWGMLWDSGVEKLAKSKTYTASLWARVATGTATLNMGPNDYYSSGFTMTTQWQRFTTTVTPAGVESARFGRGLQFQSTDQNITYYVWGAQLEEGTSASIYQSVTALNTLTTPRFAKKELMGGLYLKGEFDEVTYNASSNVQVNLVSHSQDFTQGSQWAAISGLTVTTPGFRAPDGTPTAQLLTGNGVTTGYVNTTFPWRVGNNYTFSCYFKSGTLSVVTIYLYGSYFGTTGTGGTGCDFNLANGTATPFGGAVPIIQNVGDGWYRCSVTAPAYIDRPVGDFGCQAIRMSSATGTVYAWGYQIEQSSTPSIYVRTGASGAIVNTFRQRITSNGNNYVIGSYDERSGIPVSEGLIVYLDASLAPSYNGSGTNWTGISSNKANASITSSSGGVTTSYGFNKAFDTITLNTGSLVDGQIRITGVDFNALAQSNNFTVMFAAKKDYYGSSGNLVGNSELFQAVNNGYGTGWRITENSQGSLGTPFTGTHAWSLSMSPAATPSGWGLGVSDTSTNRMCIAGFSVSPTTVYGFCNGNTTTTTNPGTYVGSTSRGYISFTGAGAGSFNGQIGFFMVYNRALTVAEMTQNYNAFRRRYNL
jgi:hypothetical protein